MFTEYLDCKDAYQRGQTASGIYTIKPDNQTAFQVYCDMDTDGGGWTVFQRRVNGSVDFYLYWADYERGFGNLTGEHWLGLRKIHRLTSNTTSQELRVELGDFLNNTRYAHYDNFYIAGTVDRYRLQVSGYRGTAGNSLNYHSGQEFSTRDQDNESDFRHCAVSYKGAWWYRGCYNANLNGFYYHFSTSNENGIKWYGWKFTTLKSTEMKLRRK